MHDVRRSARLFDLSFLILPILLLFSLACGGSEPTPPPTLAPVDPSPEPPPEAGTATPPWSDTMTDPAQFLACKGNAYALCYYSGPLKAPAGTNQPVPPLPCKLGENGDFANCKCYAFEGGKTTNYVALPSILNPEVRKETLDACGEDGTGCLNMTNEASCTSSDQEGCSTAPVCDYLGNVADGVAQTLDPNATLVSTFSMMHSLRYPIGSTSCDGTYAGCMTAACGEPYTGPDGERFVDCACPTFTGTYQFGQTNPDLDCDLKLEHVWSAANVTFTPGTDSLASAQ